MPEIAVQSLIDRIRIKTDLRDSQFFTDDELITLINESRSSLYNFILSNGDESMNLTEATLELDDEGKATLPSDWINIVSVSSEEYGYPLEIRPVTVVERNRGLYNELYGPLQYVIISNQIDVNPNTVKSVKVLYNATPTTVTAVSDTITTVHNEDRYIVADVCISVNETAEKSTISAEKERMKAEQEILGILSSRQTGLPKKIVDTKGINDIRYVYRRRRKW